MHMCWIQLKTPVHMNATWGARGRGPGGGGDHATIAVKSVILFFHRLALLFHVRTLDVIVTYFLEIPYKYLSILYLLTLTIAHAKGRSRISCIEHVPFVKYALKNA